MFIHLNEKVGIKVNTKVGETISQQWNVHIGFQTLGNPSPSLVVIVCRKVPGKHLHHCCDTAYSYSMQGDDDRPTPTTRPIPVSDRHINYA